MPAPQSFATHRRLNPLYHVVVLPLLGLNLIGQIVHCVRHPHERMGYLHATTAVALVLLALVARLHAVRVQDRIIRLEMRLRLERILPPALAGRIGALSLSQLIALRFASDQELPALVEKALAGGFASADDLKRAIVDWQADHLRV